MNVFVTNPHGYCAGVVSAIKVAIKTKKENPDRRVIVLGMLVHNQEVIEMLAAQGIETFQDPKKSLSELLDEVPSDALVIFTAHGHDKKLETQATKKGITFFDATCTKVTQNMNLIETALETGRDVIYIGKPKHPETIAALSLGKKVFLYDRFIPFDYKQITMKRPLVLNQTTISFLELVKIHDEIQNTIPDAEIIDEICSATRLRQQAVLDIPENIEVIFIVGSPVSANTEKLTEVARISHMKARVYQIKTAAEIDDRSLKNVNYVAVASGASTPLETTDEVIRHLKAL